MKILYMLKTEVFVWKAFSFPSTISAFPPFLSFCFLPPSFHRLTAVSGSSAEQPVPRGPASLPGRVMYEWLALTSLQAQRQSNSVLSGSLFLVLSLSASPRFLLNHLSPLPFSLPRFSPSPFPYLAHQFSVLWLMVKMFFVSPFWSFLFSSKAAASPSFFYLFLSHRQTNTQRHDMFEVSRQAASQLLSPVKHRLIPIQLHLSGSTLFLDNVVS